MLSTIVKDVAKGKSASSTVIFLHGLGDTGHGWSSIAESFQKQGLDQTRFIFPTANRAPVTLNGGYSMTSWHDIRSLEDIDNEEFEGIEKNKDLVNDLINAEIEKGIPANKIILAGFSQGAALSIFTGLQFPEKLGGIVALSGYLPHHQTFAKMVPESNKAVPIFVGHGTSDSVVSFQYGKRSADVLTNEVGAAKVQFNKYNGMGHSSSDQEMTDVFNFVKSCLY